MKCDNQGPIESPARILFAGNYIIPKGLEAVIEEGYVIVRPTEYERKRKSCIHFLELQKAHHADTSEIEECISFLDSLETPDESFAKMFAVSFIEFLDKNATEGKMCVSILEGEDIVNAFFDKDWAKVIAYANKYLTNERKWSAEDEKILERIINRQKFIIPTPAKDPGGFVFERREDTEAINWLKERVASRPQPNNNLRWRRANAGSNLPESIIIPDGEEPRFGKCAVKDSYYIPISELKELPKE